MRFLKKGKLSLRFIGPFEITQRIGRLVYRVALPLDLVGMHDVFHVLMLRRYIANPDAIVEYEPLGIQEGLTYVEELVKIMDKKEQMLRVEIDEDWYSVGNIEYDALDDLLGDFPQLFGTT
ncbi:uncharacterized protein LOC132178145 [Corylus avellana]|uniref:uncharacterized protein LOC132178145 n=1 Tax=Corylus avellana TaxID=13451 RepID=UPI00286D508A|nr:uncharacterized protein LOC132178145 [Corylus avellana]